MYNIPLFSILFSISIISSLVPFPTSGILGQTYWCLFGGAVHISGVSCGEPNVGSIVVDQSGGRRGLCSMCLLLPLLGHLQCSCVKLQGAVSRRLTVMYSLSALNIHLIIPGPQCEVKLLSAVLPAKNGRIHRFSWIWWSQTCLSLWL